MICFLNFGTRYSVLTAIQRELRDGAKETKLIELTNEFYTNIPQVIVFKVSL